MTTQIKILEDFIFASKQLHDAYDRQRMGMALNIELAISREEYFKIKLEDIENHLKLEKTSLQIQASELILEIENFNPGLAQAFINYMEAWVKVNNKEII